MESKPLEIKSVVIDEPSGSGPGSNGSEEFDLIKPLLTYYEMCSRGTRRVGGLRNVFENVTKGKDVIDEVPINAFIEMENNIIERESDTLVALFRESQLDPETNPIQFVALWVVGKEIIEKNDSSQTKRICAPLLIYDLEIDYLGGNKINVNFNELLPSLNYPLVEYLADIKGVSDGGVAFAFENLLNLLPEIPFELENLNEFLKTLNVSYQVTK